MQVAHAAMMPNTDAVQGDVAPCLRWTGPRHGRKQYARIHVQGTGRVYVHDLMGYYFLNRNQHAFPPQLNHGDNRSERIVVGHNNPGCHCFSPHHISLKTQSQNCLDAIAHGTMVPPNTVGTNNGHHILTWEQVEHIRSSDPLEVWKRGPGCYDIGEHQIARIRAGKAWNGDPDAHVTSSAHDGQDAPGTTQESRVSKQRRNQLGKLEMQSARALLSGWPGRRKKKGRRGPNKWEGSERGLLAQVKRAHRWVRGAWEPRVDGDDKGEKRIQALTKRGGGLFKELQQVLQRGWGPEAGTPSRNLHEMLLRCMRRRLRDVLLEQRVIENNKRWQWGLERENVWEPVQRGQRMMERDMERDLEQFANNLDQGQYDYFLMSEAERRQFDRREAQRGLYETY
jgi:hypothetical protein